MATAPGFSDICADPLVSGGGAAIEAQIAGIEALIGTRVTIHDHAGELTAPDGTGLLGQERRRHGHALCLRARQGAGGARCLAHCMRACGARAAEAGTAFVHHCWAGLHEVTVPVWSGGRHRATIFLGPWRTSRPEALERAVVLGRMLADTLLAAVARSALAADAADRRSLVLAAAVAGESLPVLARRLRLSPSRTSRVVTALCGRPWRRVLLDERLRQARALLSTTALPCAAIAARLGYATPGHFHRTFRAAEGLAPGAWRRRTQA